MRLGVPLCLGDLPGELVVEARRGSQVLLAVESLCLKKREKRQVEERVSFVLFLLSSISRARSVSGFS